MFGYLRDRTPKPEEMKQEAYERTLRARAFDISRYLLPLATNTSLGQIVSARTLENQVSRLLSHTHAEVRRLGELLKQAAREAAYNVNQAGGSAACCKRFESEAPQLAGRAERVTSARGPCRSHADEVCRAQRLRDRDRRELSGGRC